MSHITHLTVPVTHLTPDDRKEMLGLMQTYYLGVTRKQFESDLDEKDHVILLRSMEGDGRVLGFSTLMRLDLTINGVGVKAVFSGDTIVARESRMTLGLGVEIASYFVWSLGQCPGTELYYILIAKGWQTCRIPALLFREFSPSLNRPSVARHQQVMDAFGARKYATSYQPETGQIISSGESQRVIPCSAEGCIPTRDNPQVDFFVRRNPGYLRGDELVYVAPIKWENFSPTSLRLLASSGKGRRVD